MTNARVLLVGIGDFQSGFQSGRPRALYREMAQELEVHTLELPRPSVYTRALGAADRTLHLGLTLPERQKPLREKYFRRLLAEAKRLGPDVVISTTTLPFCGQMSVPTVAWPDAPLNFMIDDEAYPALVALRDRTKLSYLRAEQTALESVALAAMPSNMGVAAVEKIAPISRTLRAPFGPNLDRIVLDQARALRAHRSENRIKQILFIGLDWHRKGGGVAVEAVDILNERGLNCELVIVGQCPDGIANLPHVRYAGQLNNSTASGQREFVSILSTADAFLFPTRADNYGAVIVESAAIGLPVVASTRAGASEYISENSFGYSVGTFSDKTEEATAYADALEQLFSDSHTLAAAGAAGIDAHRSTLNYLTSVRNIIDAIQ